MNIFITAWDFRCRQLLEFRARFFFRNQILSPNRAISDLCFFPFRFGHTHVPDNWKTNQDLPKWICEVRRLYRLGRLDREKILQALTIKLDLESSEISEEPILKGMKNNSFSFNTHHDHYRCIYVIATVSNTECLFKWLFLLYLIAEFVTFGVTLRCVLLIRCTPHLPRNFVSFKPNHWWNR